MQWDVHCVKLTAVTYIYMISIRWVVSRSLYVQVVGFIKWSRFASLPPCSLCLLTPTIQLNSTFGWCGDILHIQLTTVRVIISLGRLVLLCVPETSLSFRIWLMHGTTVHSKTITLFMNFFSWKPHSGNIVCWDQEFWMTDTGWHFEEWCFRYNYTLFIWVIFQERKTLIIIGKQCYRNDG